MIRSIALRQLDGIIDIYLPDFKYSDNALAKAASPTAPIMSRHRIAAIGEMIRQQPEIPLSRTGS